MSFLFLSLSFFLSFSAKGKDSERGQGTRGDKEVVNEKAGRGVGELRMRIC
jgi:hypothetical protein